MIEKSAKTVEEAVNEALAELNVTKDNVEIEVLEDDIIQAFVDQACQPAGGGK